MTSRAPLTFDIPAGSPPRSCLGCGARIFWIETKTGKRMPVNADGVSHFATCPKSTDFRGTTRAGQAELFGRDGGNRR